MNKLNKDTATLQNAALDYAVALAKELTISINIGDQGGVVVVFDASIAGHRKIGVAYKPSRDHHGDDIIDEEGIATRRHSNGKWYAIMSNDLGDGSSASWSEKTYKNGHRYGPLSYEVSARVQRAEGETRREAAMRCFVLSKLGEKVSIPKSVLS